MSQAVKAGPMREQTHLTPAVDAKFYPSEGFKAVDENRVLTIQNPNQISPNSASN